jgi:hypothetical protein
MSAAPVVYRPARSVGDGPVEIHQHPHGIAPPKAPCMNGIFFYIGLGAGLAAACGLRPYLPALLAGALGSAGALGVGFHGHFHFLQANWWLLAVALVLVLSYLLQLRLGSERFAAAAHGAVTAQALAVGALLFAGTLAAHGDAWWPGLIGGAAAAWVAQRAVAPVISGARARLSDRSAREALSVYLDSAALLLAALSAALHPLGYVAIAALAWFSWRRRSRADEKYAGLRILRR